MVPILKQFLLRTASKEHAALIERSDRLLNNLGVNLHHQSIEFILSHESESNSAELLIEIDDVYYDCIQDTLSEHGFTLNTDRLHDVTDFMECVLSIQNYEDKQTILDIINSDLEPIEKLGEVLYLVGEFDPTHYQTLVEKMNPMTIDLLKDSLGDQDLNIGDQVPTRQDIVDRTFIFLKQYPNSLIKTWLDHSIRIGYDLDKYLSLLSDIDLVNIDSDLYYLVETLFGCVVISSTLNKDIRDEVRMLFVKYIDDKDKLAKAERMLSDKFMTSLSNNS